MAEEKPRPKPPILAQTVTGLSFALLYIPLLALVFYSFRTPGSSGFTWTWYEQAFSDQAVLQALGVSLQVGMGCALGATLLGTLTAFALDRKKFYGKKIFRSLVYVPLIMPEIVLGLALLIWFVALRLTLGTFSIILAHITFSVSYVIITVQARLQGFDHSLQEAAMDLGATPWQIFKRITFPLVWPGILSGALLAFTLSFDDFLITFFTAGVGSDTLPLKIYAMIKFGVSPEINALSTLMLGATFLGVWFFTRPFKKNHP